MTSSTNPSEGHWRAAKYVLKYLKGTASHGVQGCVAIPDELQGDKLLLFTDSNWGPQDVSQPVENETQTVTKQKLKSIQGFI